MRKVADDYIAIIAVDLTTEEELKYLLDGRDTVHLPEWSDSALFSTNILQYANTIVAP